MYGLRMDRMDWSKRFCFGASVRILAESASNKTGTTLGRSTAMKQICGESPHGFQNVQIPSFWANLKQQNQAAECVLISPKGHPIFQPSPRNGILLVVQKSATARSCPGSTAGSAFHPWWSSRWSDRVVHISQRWFPDKQNTVNHNFGHMALQSAVSRAQTIGEAPRNFGNAIFT